MTMKQTDNKTGSHVFTPNLLTHSDVSTVRRMLGGVHSFIVVTAWSDSALMAKLLMTAHTVTAAALDKASKAH